MAAWNLFCRSVEGDIGICSPRKCVSLGRRKIFWSRKWKKCGGKYLLEGYDIWIVDFLFKCIFLILSRRYVCILLLKLDQALLKLDENNG